MEPMPASNSPASQVQNLAISKVVEQMNRGGSEQEDVLMDQAGQDPSPPAPVNNGGLDALAQAAAVISDREGPAAPHPASHLEDRRYETRLDQRLDEIRVSFTLLNPARGSPCLGSYLFPTGGATLGTILATMNPLNLGVRLQSQLLIARDAVCNLLVDGPAVDPSFEGLRVTVTLVDWDGHVTTSAAAEEVLAAAGSIVTSEPWIPKFVVHVFAPQWQGSTLELYYHYGATALRLPLDQHPLPQGFTSGHNQDLDRTYLLREVHRDGHGRVGSLTPLQDRNPTHAGVPRSSSRYGIPIGEFPLASQLCFNTQAPGATLSDCALAYRPGHQPGDKINVPGLIAGEGFLARARKLIASFFQPGVDINDLKPDEKFPIRSTRLSQQALPAPAAPQFVGALPAVAPFPGFPVPGMIPVAQHQPTMASVLSAAVGPQQQLGVEPPRAHQIQGSSLPQSSGAPKSARPGKGAKKGRRQ